jgi:hypothetical protein
MGSPPQSMVYLYGLLVLSLAALLWAVWAITKHVRRQAGAEGPDGGELDEAKRNLESPDTHPLKDPVTQEAVTHNSDGIPQPSDVERKDAPKRSAP